MRELAISQDIDPDSLVNDMNDAQLYAKLLQGLQNAQQQASPNGQPPNQQPAGMAGAGGVPQQPEGLDRSGVGNGTIGTGDVPSAGEAGFTGNTDQIEGQLQ